MNSTKISTNGVFQPRICEVKYDENENEINEDYTDEHFYEDIAFIDENENLYTEYDSQNPLKITQWRFPANSKNKSKINNPESSQITDQKEPEQPVKITNNAPTNSPVFNTNQSPSKSILIPKIDDNISKSQIFKNIRTSIPFLPKTNLQNNSNEYKSFIDPFQRSRNPIQLYRQSTNISEFKINQNVIYQESIEKLKNPVQALKQSGLNTLNTQFLKNKNEISIAMPPIKRPSDIEKKPTQINKENIYYVNFVSNPYTFNPKPREEKKSLQSKNLITTLNRNNSGSISKNTVKNNIKPISNENDKSRKKQMNDDEKKSARLKINEESNEETRSKSDKKSKKKKDKKNKDFSFYYESNKKTETNSKSSSDLIEEKTNDDLPRLVRPGGAQIGKRKLREMARISNKIDEELNNEITKSNDQLKNEDKNQSDEIKKENYIKDKKYADSDKLKIKRDLKPNDYYFSNQTKNDLENKNEIEIKKDSNENKSGKNFDFSLEQISNILSNLQKGKHLTNNKNDDSKIDEFRLEDDWLLKWCILENYKNKACETIFSKFLTNKKNYLNGENLLKAIESIIKLNNLKRNYLFSVLNLCNVDPIKDGADIKLFSIIIALAQRVNHLDENWFSNMLPQYDLFTIENKVFKVKNLWSYLVDQETKLINMSDLLIEFEAGGVSSDHLTYAKEKFANKKHFGILDYLTYIPLFVYIHDKIVNNPFIIKEDI